MEEQVSQKTAGTVPASGEEVPAAPNTEEFTLSKEDTHETGSPPGQTEAFALKQAGTTSRPQKKPTEAFALDQPASAPADTRPPAKPEPVPAAKPEPAAAAPSGVRRTFRNYRLIKKLGQGGMGAVFLAHQISLDRPVALKVLSKDLANRQDFVQRFTYEARIMAKLDHPNILRCYEVGEEAGYHYLAMEYVEGGSLGDWLKKLGKFSLGDSLHAVLACAQALQHAHELKLIHRDIKPDNILLTKRGVIKVADLGLAKATNEDLGLTKTGAGAGTPLYMAPEQARDAKRVDQRSDIYALGCMLYVFLTGTFPFTGESLLEVIEAKEKSTLKPARKLNDEIPERLDLFIDKMLAPKPEHRYQSCAQVIADLESLGLANSCLSFMAGDGVARPAPAPAPKKVSPPLVPTPTPPPLSTPTPAPLSGTGLGAAAAAPAVSYWYASFTGKDGKAVTRKMTTDEILGHIRSKAFDVETSLSRTLKGGYRALGTYSEFQHLLKAAITAQRADIKSRKFRTLYAQIEAQDKSRRRWRWLREKLRDLGGIVSFLLWFGTLMAIAIGLYYLAIWAWPLVTEKLGAG